MVTMVRAIRTIYIVSMISLADVVNKRRSSFNDIFCCVMH